MNYKEWFAKQPKWLKALTIMVLAALTAISMFTSCATTHSVTHTFINHKTGDTITQRYEQIGKTLMVK